MGRTGKSKRGGLFACCFPSSPDDMGVVPMPEFEPPQIKTRQEPTRFANDTVDVTEEESIPEEDPCEQAYRLWYEKGMLSFVPKSVIEEDARREQMKIVPPPRDSPSRSRGSGNHSPPRVSAVKPRSTYTRSAPVVREEPHGPPKVTRKSLGVQKVRREERPRAMVEPPSSTDEPWTSFPTQPAFESASPAKNKYNMENLSPKKNRSPSSSPSKKPKKPCGSCGQTRGCS